MTGPVLQLWSYSVPSTEFVPIYCQYWSRQLLLVNQGSVDLTMRTDPDNPVTQDVLPAGQSQQIGSVFEMTPGFETWWPLMPGRVIVWMQAASGTGTCVVRGIAI